jgi:hypothetical protein
MFCFEVDAAFDIISERTQADAWKFILCPVVKTVNPSKIAFRDQLRFGRQPVLYVVPGLRSLVDIIQVCPSGHFIRRWHKTNCALVQVHSRSWW